MQRERPHHDRTFLNEDGTPHCCDLEFRHSEKRNVCFRETLVIYTMCVSAINEMVFFSGTYLEF